MKKIMLLCAAMLLIVSFNSCKSNVQKEPEPTTIEPQYVDLGLPSGTLWKNINEDSMYIYNNAVSVFGENLPSGKQWKELMEIGVWNMQKKGYEVVGPSGNSIFIPADGYKSCGGSVFLDTDNNGYYWSSDDGGAFVSARDALCFIFPLNFCGKKPVIIYQNVANCLYG